MKNNLMEKVKKAQEKQRRLYNKSNKQGHKQPAYSPRMNINDIRDILQYSKNNRKKNLFKDLEYYGDIRLRIGHTPGYSGEGYPYLSVSKFLNIIYHNKDTPLYIKEEIVKNASKYRYRIKKKS